MAGKRQGEIVSIDVSGWFEAYEWSASEVEPGIWQASFATEWEEDFDLYTMLSDEWLRLIISPVIARPAEDAAPRIATTLLRINQSMQLARFALDDDGDVCLIVDLPVEDLAYATFAAAMDVLLVAVQTLARALARMAANPTYWPPELADLLK